MDNLSDNDWKTLTSSEDFQRGYNRLVFATVNDQEEQQYQQQPATRGRTEVAAAKPTQDLKNKYDKLQDSTRKKVTLESFIHTFSDATNMTMLSVFLGKEGEDEVVQMLVQKQAELGQKQAELGQKQAELDQDLVRLIAENMLSKLPESLIKPEDIDGSLVAYISNPPITRKETRDEWGYAEFDNQSYNTVATSAQYSSTTVKDVLNSDNVHFNMFAEGKTKVECIRFGFVGNPLETVDPSSTVVEDPTEIDANFFEDLFHPKLFEDKLPHQMY